MRTFEEFPVLRETLAKKEYAAFKLLLQGLEDDAIAVRLEIGRRMVQVYRHRIGAKLGKAPRRDCLHRALLKALYAEHVRMQAHVRDLGAMAEGVE